MIRAYTSIHLHEGDVSRADSREGIAWVNIGENVTLHINDEQALNSLIDALQECRDMKSRMERVAV